MAGYVKLFGSILDSTVWVGQSAATKVMWVTVLAMKDADGVVSASVPGLALRAGVTVAECEAALTIFLSPDVYSRTKDYDGRRIEAVDGGWQVLNHEKYKFMETAEIRRTKAAERQKRYREAKALRSVTSVTSNALSPHTDTDPNTDPKKREAVPLTGHELKRLFAAIREKQIPGTLGWQTPVTKDGKDSTMADLINADPSARADVVPTMELFFKTAKDGKRGKDSKKMLDSPAFGFGCWMSDWTALREELRGKTNGAHVKTRMELAQDAEAAAWRDR